MLGRYQGYSPLGGEGEHLNGILLGTKVALPAELLGRGGSQLSWLGRALVAQILNRHNSARESVFSVELEGRGFCETHDKRQ